MGNYHSLPTRLINFFTHIHNDYIFTRCENLLDHYPAFAIEHFMHGVKKGVISGMSNTILSAVIEKKAICICDDLPIEEKPETYQMMRKLLHINEWEGFSHAGEGKIYDSIRHSDLIEYLLNTNSTSGIRSNV